MARHYSTDECVRKADRHWELAGLARQDGDRLDDMKHTKLARLWDKRASEGGHMEGE